MLCRDLGLRTVHRLRTTDCGLTDLVLESSLYTRTVQRYIRTRKSKNIDRRIEKMTSKNNKRARTETCRNQPLDNGNDVQD